MHTEQNQQAVQLDEVAILRIQNALLTQRIAALAAEASRMQATAEYCAQQWQAALPKLQEPENQPANGERHE